MNILYGVQGTGNGHISRSREIIRHLKDRGHHVEVILSGRAPDAFWDMDDFAKEFSVVSPYKGEGAVLLDHSWHLGNFRL